MRTGNIYKTFHGSVIIITKVTDDYVHWISATHANSSGGTNKLTTVKEVSCDCLIDCCEPSIDCPDCKGTGTMEKTIYGMEMLYYRIRSFN